MILHWDVGDRWDGGGSIGKSRLDIILHMWETSAKASATQIWARLLWDSPASNLKVDLGSLSTADALSGASASADCRDT